MDLWTDQPYPDVHPWYDLRPYLINGWEQKGNAACAFRVMGNSLQVVARPVVGTDRMITSGMPNFHTSSSGKLIPASMVLGGGEFLAGVVIWAGGGDLSMHWTWPSDNSMQELILTGTVPR